VLEVKRLRQEREWNQTELAYHAGLAPSVISQIENGKRDPTARTLRKLAEALSVEVADLFPKKAQAPLPLDGSVGGAGDPGEAAKMIRALASTAAELASAWNQDVELYEQHGRSLLPYRTMEMGLAVEGLYQHFWGALSVLQQHAESLGHDPNPAAWEPQSKELLIEAGSNIRALAELHVLIERSAEATETDRDDLRARREEFGSSTPAELEDLLGDLQRPEAMEKARTATGIP
jgi:transcriptional regulator with XRE-family HTH domain